MFRSLRSLPSLQCKLALLAAVELFARNGTQMEPRLRTNDAYFKTLHFVEPERVGKCRVFPKLEIEPIRIDINFANRNVQKCYSRPKLRQTCFRTVDRLT